jgi:sugar lactone lactonase YvrE
MKSIKELRRIKVIEMCMVAALLYISSGAFACELFDDFPDFISFTGGLAIDKTGEVVVDTKGNVYVNVTVEGRVNLWQFSSDGDLISTTDICTGDAYGLTMDNKGNIYIAVTGEDQGVYRVDRRGNVVLLPGTDQIVAANALTFDQRGNLYVTESLSGAPGDYGQGGIWRIPQRGEAELVLRDDLLTGTGAVLGFPMGANGIAYYRGNLYVANSDKGLIVKIPIKRNGELGQPGIWKVLEAIPEALPPLAAFPIMGDGIKIDEFGNIYIAVVSKCAVIRITARDLTQETIAVLGSDTTDPLYAPLSTPNSVAFYPGMGLRKGLLVTNVGMIPGLGPGKGLVKIEIDAPGYPCHRVFRGWNLIHPHYWGKWFKIWFPD